MLYRVVAESMTAKKFRQAWGVVDKNMTDDQSAYGKTHLIGVIMFHENTFPTDTLTWRLDRKQFMGALMLRLPRKGKK